MVEDEGARVLLGGDHGLVPAPLGAFPQAILGCDDRTNILFAAGSPPLQQRTTPVKPSCWIVYSLVVKTDSP